MTVFLLLFAIVTLASLSVVGLLLQIYLCYVRRRWRRRLVLPELTAYVGKDSFEDGETIEVCVHTTQMAAASLFRLGAEAEAPIWAGRVEPTMQSTQYDHWRGFQWQVNLSIETHGLDSGLYILQLEQKGGSVALYRLPILLKPAGPIEIAVISSTNTWQAYNDFGGLSNYSDEVTPRPLRWLKQFMVLLNWRIVVGNRHSFPCVPLPRSRPNTAINDDLKELDACPIQTPSHLVRAEWSLLRYLEKQGLRYGVYSDLDLAIDAQIGQAKVLVFNTHSEYWSPEMTGRLRSFLELGGHALFVSGNNQYRQVQLLEHGLKVDDFKTPRAPVARLLGAAYDALGYMTYAGYRVAAPDHWLFDGLDLKFDELFAGAACDGEGQFGASGYETDKLTQDSGKVSVLAIGQNREGPAYMICKDVGKGRVLNTGSVASAPWVEKDAVLANVVNRFIERSGVAYSSPGNRNAA